MLTAMAYVELNPIRAGIAETPETSDFTSVQKRIEVWQGRHESAWSDEKTPEPDDTNSLDATIVKLLEFSEDSQDNIEKTIPYSTTDYLELVDWSGRAIVEGKKEFIPEQLPPILQRLNMRPEEYLAYVRKPKYGFANALGALEKIKACADHFEKAFLKGETAAAALFSPGR